MALLVAVMLIWSDILGAIPEQRLQIMTRRQIEFGPLMVMVVARNTT